VSAGSCFTVLPFYRGADKSLARPGRKHANVNVRRLVFSSAPCLVKKNLTARVSMLLKLRASLLACFLPGRAKDLSAPWYVEMITTIVRLSKVP